MHGNKRLKMLKCFLCEKSGTSVKKFNEEILGRCRNIHAYRKQKNLKQLDVVLPVLCSQLRGYHIQCYDKFIMLKSNSKKEFESMFNNDKVLNKTIPPLKIDSPTAFKKNTASKNIDIPKLIEMPDMGTRSYDINLKTTSKTYEMDEPSYINPDISRGVILKSILTRKSPIKKDMLNNPLAFNSGIDFLRYGIVFNQPNFGLNEEKLGQKTETVNDCIFCGTVQRKIGTLVEVPQITKDNEYKKVLQVAKALEDKVLLLKLLRTNKVCSSHALCRVEYKNRQQKITSKNCDEEERLVIKNLESKVFEAFFAFIADEIIAKNKTYFLTDLFERYKAIQSDIQNATTLEIDISNVQNLQEEILKHFEGRIRITTKAKKKVVSRDGTIDLDSALIENENLKYDKVAFEFRSEIKTLKRKSDAKIEEEIPEKLLRFVSSLIQGPYVNDCYEDSLKIKAFCQQIVMQVNKD